MVGNGEGVNTMTHLFYPKDGSEPQAVEPEEWMWEVHYNNGNVFGQFDHNGIFHQFSEIDQENIGMVMLVSQHHPPVVIMWRLGLKLIQFMYRTGRLRIGTEEESYYRLPCLGYQDQCGPHILIVMPDGTVVLTDDVERIKIN